MTFYLAKFHQKIWTQFFRSWFLIGTIILGFHWHMPELQNKVQRQNWTDYNNDFVDCLSMNNSWMLFCGYISCVCFTLTKNTHTSSITTSHFMTNTWNKPNRRLNVTTNQVKVIIPFSFEFGLFWFWICIVSIFLVLSVSVFVILGFAFSSGCISIWRQNVLLQINQWIDWMVIM